MYKIAKEKRHTTNEKRSTRERFGIRVDVCVCVFASIIVVFDKSLNAHCMVCMVLMRPVIWG